MSHFLRYRVSAIETHIRLSKSCFAANELPLEGCCLPSEAFDRSLLIVKDEHHGKKSSVPRSSSSSLKACEIAGDEILSFSEAFLTDLPSATAKKDLNRSQIKFRRKHFELIFLKSDLLYF